MSQEQGKKTSNWFAIGSWVITALVVLIGAGFVAWRFASKAQAAPAPTAAPTQKEQTDASASAALPASGSVEPVDSIRRMLTLKTNMPDRPRYDVIQYTVETGDALFSIAKSFNIKPETLLWANYDALNDDPDSIRPGQKLNIPPLDGVLYQWKQGDTLDSVATSLSAKPQDIVSWVGNKLDLASPSFEPGQYVMVPGGHREFRQWIIPTVTRAGNVGASSSSCSGGAYGGGGFIWPSNNHFLSGNDYSSFHHGIDIAGNIGDAVYASDSGVVTLAATGYNYGYGNVIMIDHGNGYVTLYAHLSALNVGHCASVGQGQVIGAIGSTGNSTGAHLHFEVRLNGGFVNPWDVLP